MVPFDGSTGEPDRVGTIAGRALLRGAFAVQFAKAGPEHRPNSDRSDARKHRIPIWMKHVNNSLADTRALQNQRRAASHKNVPL
jgi:hypothetical protein